MPEPLLLLTHRPTLNDMRRLQPPSDADRAARETTGQEAARARHSAIHPPAYFEGRAGFAPDFLGAFATPMPVPTGANAHDILAIPDSDDQLDYQHFSVVMSKSRRIAMWVAVNIDGSKSKKIEREGDAWFLDGRIPVEAQIGEELYAGNGLDRGHLVRREDPNWGNAKTALQGNEDTFHFTNCAPQMAAFNQKTWLGLENYILLNARKWKDRATVFTGPFLRRSDLPYRGARIPIAYWKVVAFVSDDGRPSATAYIIDQETELGELEAAFGRYKTYQRSIRYVEKRAKLDFGALRNYDGFSNEELDKGVELEAAIETLSDIRV